jgi:hypothetical protein
VIVFAIVSPSHAGFFRRRSFTPFVPILAPVGFFDKNISGFVALGVTKRWIAVDFWMSASAGFHVGTVAASAGPVLAGASEVGFLGACARVLF